LNRLTRYSYKRQPQSKVCSELYAQSKPDTDRLSGFLFADGRVSIGRIPRYKLSQSDSEYERNAGKHEVLTRTHWDYREGLVEEKIHLSHIPSSSSLGLSSVPNYQENSVRKRYGLKGITLNGARRVKLGAYLLQRRYGKRLGFYTLTCPYTIATDIFEYNKSIAEISRRYFQALKKVYEDASVVWSCTYVYEYQEERYERDGIPVLHLHYVAPCYYPGTKEFVLSADLLRYLWAWACKQVIGKECDPSASVDAQVVKKSAAGYLAKYLSKGGGTYKYLAETCPSQMPGQWWGMTANVRKAIRITTTPLSLPVSQYLFYQNGDSPGGLLHCIYCRYIDIPLGVIDQFGEPVRLRVGMSARLCSAGCNALQTWTYEDLRII